MSDYWSWGRGFDPRKFYLGIFPCELGLKRGHPTSWGLVVNCWTRSGIIWKRSDIRTWKVLVKLNCANCSSHRLARTNTVTILTSVRYELRTRHDISKYVRVAAVFSAIRKCSKKAVISHAHYRSSGTLIILPDSWLMEDFLAKSLRLIKQTGCDLLSDFDRFVF